MCGLSVLEGLWGKNTDKDTSREGASTLRRFHLVCYRRKNEPKDQVTLALWGKILSHVPFCHQILIESRKKNDVITHTVK